MIEKSWGINENDNHEKDQELIKEKLELLRGKLLARINEKTQRNSMKNASFDEVKKLFMSFDTSNTFNLTFGDFENAIKRLHIEMNEMFLGAVFKKIDMNNSGFIEFQEFYEFLVI